MVELGNSSLETAPVFNPFSFIAAAAAFAALFSLCFSAYTTSSLGTFSDTR